MKTPEEHCEIKCKKQRLRHFALQQRHRQPHKLDLSRIICAFVQSLPKYAEAKTVCSYIGVGDEVLTSGLVQNALAQGKRIVVPYVHCHRLVLYHLQSIEELEPAPFGLMEPPVRRRTQPGMEIDPAEVQCFLVPGLAFGLKGERLGHGKGYYDDLLGRTSPHAHKIGLCFTCQIVKDLPTLDHDVYVDLVVTEQGI